MFFFKVVICKNVYVLENVQKNVHSGEPRHIRLYKGGLYVSKKRTQALNPHKHRASQSFFVRLRKNERFLFKIKNAVCFLSYNCMFFITFVYILYFIINNFLKRI